MRLRVFVLMDFARKKLGSSDEEVGTQGFSAFITPSHCLSSFALRDRGLKGHFSSTLVLFWSSPFFPWLSLSIAHTHLLLSLLAYSPISFLPGLSCSCAKGHLSILYPLGAKLHTCPSLFPTSTRMAVLILPWPCSS